MFAQGGGFLFVFNHCSGLLQVGFFPFVWGIAVPAGGCSADTSCFSAGFLLLSSFPAQLARRVGKCHTPDMGWLSGMAAISNIWISSGEVISRSKSKFRLKGGEVPL